MPVETQELARVEAPQGGLLEAIRLATMNPDVDPAKMRELVQLQIDINRQAAEIEFNAALARLQLKLPRISKDGLIQVSGQVRSRYMRYEDIDRAIRPLLAEEGFSVSFTTEYAAPQLVVTGRLSHRLGHFRECSMPLAIDSSGSKNGTQAIGSTLSYGKRYTVCALLNIVAEGEDDDGYGGSEPLTEDQRKELWALIERTNTVPEKFLKFAGVAELADILQRDFKKCKDALLRKAK
jgi:hypothetical protein